MRLAGRGFSRERIVVAYYPEMIVKKGGEIFPLSNGGMPLLKSINS